MKEVGKDSHLGHNYCLYLPPDLKLIHVTTVTSLSPLQPSQPTAVHIISQSTTHWTPQQLSILKVLDTKQDVLSISSQSVYDPSSLAAWVVKG